MFERPFLLWLLLLAPLAAAPQLLGWRSTRRVANLAGAILRMACFAVLVAILAAAMWWFSRPRPN